jgi:acetyl-CoA synthetase
MVDEEKRYDELYESFDWDTFAREHLDWNPAERLNVAHECVDRHASDPQKVALFCILPDGTEEKYTYRDLKNLSSRFANGLRALGINMGDTVARLLPRIPEAYITFLGTWKAGAIDIPLYTAFQPESIEHRVRDSGAKLIVTDVENRVKLDRIKGGLEGVKVVVVTRDRELVLQRGDISFWAEVENAPGDFKTIETKPEDIAVLQYTSGTTGLPKGTAITHKGFIAVLPYAKYLMDVRDNDIFWGYADPACA